MPDLKKKPNKNKQRSTTSRPLLSVNSTKKKSKQQTKISKDRTYNLRVLPEDYSFTLQKSGSSKKLKTSKSTKTKKTQARTLRVSADKQSFKLQKTPTRKKPKASKTKPTFVKKLQQVLPAVFIIIGLAGTIYFSAQVRKTRNPEQPATFSLAAPDIQESRPAEPEDTSLPPSEPNRVTIKSVGIDYGVKPVGKLADGSMETPNVLESITGWYKYSPTPGEIGPSVIVGHVDSYQGPSVFWRLREVKPGDIVEVARADGKTANFKITALKQFDQANFPTQEVYGNVDKAELRLITCGGTFNKQTQHYTENTVVFATLIT